MISPWLTDGFGNCQIGFKQNVTERYTLYWKVDMHEDFVHFWKGKRFHNAKNLTKMT